MKIIIILMAALIGCLYAISQIVIGYQGIEHYYGMWWALLALGVAFVFRFTLPITIGAYFGATTVLGWPWYYALLFVAPGLALIVPGVLLMLLSMISFRRK